MGTQQKKKVVSEDFRNAVAEMKRKQDQDITKVAIQPSLELGYSPTGIGTIDFVNVSTSIVTGTQTGT